MPFQQGRVIRQPEYQTNYTVFRGIWLEISVHAVSFLFVPTVLRSVEDDEQEDLKVRDIKSGQMEQIHVWQFD